MPVLECGSVRRNRSVMGYGVEKVEDLVDVTMLPPQYMAVGPPDLTRSASRLAQLLPTDVGMIGFCDQDIAEAEGMLREAVV